MTERAQYFQNELIIQIMTESHEIDNLKRKIEDAKMKLVTGIKVTDFLGTYPTVSIAFGKINTSLASWVILAFLQSSKNALSLRNKLNKIKLNLKNGSTQLSLFNILHWYVS